MLESSHLKLRRAEEHIDALDAEIRKYLESEPHRVTSERENASSGIVFVEVIKDFDPVVAILAGDAAHNLRAALDHIAYAVSDAKHRRASYFPICTVETDYLRPRTCRKPMREEALGGVPADLLTVFDDAQPYHRGDEARDHPLACIARLDNADKHRAIQPGIGVLGTMKSISLQAPPRPPGSTPGHADVEWFPQGMRLTFGTKTKVFRWTITPAPEGDVRVKLEPSLTVSFGNRCAMTDLLAARDLIRDEILPEVEAKLGG